MEKIFNSKERNAIENKKQLFQKIIEGSMSTKELIGIITNKRLGWLKNNMHLLRKDLPLEEAAYRLIVYDYMKVDGGILIKRVSKHIIETECRNFCPYLEACNELGLDTKKICKEILEPPAVAVLKKIDPKINFSRDYSHVRPYSDYCLEFVEVQN